MGYNLSFAGGRNNCMFYYAPIHTIAGGNEIQTALAYINGFDLVVVGVHTGADLVLLNKVMEGSKSDNANIKWFGYVPFGSTGSGVSATSVDQWLVDCPPSSGLLDGIFLDEFGHDFPSGDRNQQNAIVDYCHDTILGGTGLPVFVNPWIPTDVFGQPPNNSNNAAPSVGSDADHTDIVLVESFLTSVDSSSPPANTNWTRDKGRTEYYINQRDNKDKNIQVCVMMGVGIGTGVDANTQIDETTYRHAHNYLAHISADWLCVNNGDIGASSNKFYIQHIADINVQAIPSGTSQLIKF